MQDVTKYLAVYELHRSYGGPEEGGWWFDGGELVYCEPVAPDATDEQITARREALKAEWFDPEARPVSSVIYSGGQYGVYIENGIPARHFPEEHPRYE